MGVNSRYYDLTNLKIQTMRRENEKTFYWFLDKEAEMYGCSTWGEYVRKEGEFKAKTLMEEAAQKYGDYRHSEALKGPGK